MKKKGENLSDMKPGNSFGGLDHGSRGSRGFT